MAASTISHAPVDRSTRCAPLRQEMADERLRVRAYTREHGIDPPAVRDWTLPAR